MPLVPSFDLRDTFGALRPVEKKYVEELEKMLGVPLPETYREFLLEYGSCSPGNGYLSFDIEPGWDMDLRSFLGPSSETVYDLKSVVEGYQDRIRKSLIPIVMPQGAGMVCLGISGEDRGKVFFWDQDNEMVGNLEWTENVHLLAPDYESFILSLKAEPYDDES